MRTLSIRAEELVSGGVWAVTEEEAGLACGAASGLADAMGPQVGRDRAGLPDRERLMCLREALAVLALTMARARGHLAWLLAAGSTELVPVLQWRAATADPVRAFGTVRPSVADLADAEQAAHHLHTTLSLLPDHARQQPHPA
ncbi:hypothetical protein [Streptomyces sp. NPDC097619]|uniref:hypothetical protein n=1 Tax=Streptomyces sp. NPDC097619 TaxID=3157228 RepID=UPI00332919EA